MNTLYFLNWLIFSAFATLFVVEVGIALLALFNYRHYRDEIRKYLLPIWEVDGTFAGLYLVNFEITYPTLLGLFGQLYIAPLLVAGIFFILRSVFLVYSAYTDSPDKEDLYIKIYALSTLIMVLIAGSVVNSGISGIGVSIQNATISILQLILNPFNIIMLLGLFLISIFVVSSCLKLEKVYKYGIVYLVTALALFGAAFYSYVPLIFANAISSLYLVGAGGVMGIVAAIMQLKGMKYANHLTILWLFGSFNIFGAIAYPYIFGSAQITGYMASAEASGPIIWITLIGGALVLGALSYLIYLTYAKKEKLVY